MASFFDELKRRHVFRVAAAYAAVAWLLAQIADTVLPVFGVPPIYMRSFLVLLGIGFPVALVTAWLYDLTPEGLQRTDDDPDTPPSKTLSGRRLEFIIIACLTVALAFLVYDRTAGTAASAPSVSSIAVLPLTVPEELGGDLESLQFSVGLADSLILRLSKIPALKVKSLAALPSLDDNELNIGRALGVNAVCTLRLARRGSILEVAAQLVDVRDGTVLWGEIFRPQAANLITIDADITAEIARRLELELSASDELALRQSSTQNPEAHRLYLQGRYYWNQRTEAGLRESADLFRRAVDLDSDFALAWSGLADSYFMLFAWGFEPPGATASRVLAAAERAAGLDPTLAAPHATLGYFKTIYERDWTGARAEFDRAIALNPNYSTAYHWQAFFLSTMDEQQEAVEAILKAREFEPLSAIINTEVPVFHAYNGQVERAVDALNEADRMELGTPGFPYMRVRILATAGRVEEGLAAAEVALAVGSLGIVADGFYGIAYPKIGLDEEARAIYERGIEESKTGYVAPGILAILAASLGENDAAFMHIDAALEERSMILSWLRDPLLDEFREDPRYPELMLSVGLEP